jgi:hypothetical protein
MVNMRGRGRPIGSKVRQNIVEILYFFKKLHGYELYKTYLDLYPKVTMRLIYYHMKKGISTGEFKIDKVERKSGKYSWGSDVENIIYALGPAAKPIVEPRIKLYCEEHQKNNKKEK